MKIIAGLGNPESYRSFNRHNVGFLFLDRLKSKFYPTENWTLKFLGKFLKGEKVSLLKPCTGMNDSGESIKLVFKDLSSDLIIIHDDLDLPLGRWKTRIGGENGHRGLRSIRKNIGDSFLRYRVGIGRPEHKRGVLDYVLGDFTKKEFDELQCVFDDILQQEDFQ